MNSLDKQSRVAEITSLRAKIKTNPALHVELLASISRTLREHGVRLDDRVISDIWIALPDELTSEFAKEVDLPGGTNCAKP